MIVIDYLLMCSFVFLVFYFVTKQIRSRNQANSDAGTAMDEGCWNSSLKWNVPWYILLFTKMLWGWKCCCHKRKTWYGTIDVSCCTQNSVSLCLYACAFIPSMLSARLNSLYYSIYIPVLFCFGLFLDLYLGTRQKYEGKCIIHWKILRKTSIIRAMLLTKNLCLAWQFSGTCGLFYQGITHF